MNGLNVFLLHCTFDASAVYDTTVLFVTLVICVKWLTTQQSSHTIPVTLVCLYV